MQAGFFSYEKANARGDDTSFRDVAAEIIQDERRKRHQVMADELEHALNRSSKRV